MLRNGALKRLIIHCSDTPDGRHTTAREIDRWHAARVDISGRDDGDLVYAPQFPYCGYHGVILLDGELVRTRAETEIGSHCKGVNSESLGFCLIGTEKYTLSQWETLAWLVDDVLRRWGALQIEGHRAHNPAKTCPGFDVQTWLEGGMQPLTEHVWTPSKKSE